MRPFTLPGPVVRSLASASPDPVSTDSLRRSRLNRTMLMVLGIARRRGGQRGLLDVISAAQEADAAAVADVLSYPWVGVWAAGCLRPGGDRHVAYLRNVAAACAHRAGVADALPRSLTEPAMLPAVGLRRPDGRLVALRGLDLPSGTGQHHVRVDDLDPYRDCHGPPVAARLTDQEWDRWRVTIAEAWQLLTEHSPAWAGDLAAGMSVITPLRAVPSGQSMSVTHGDSFGGFAAVRPATAGELAVMLVHEFQHSKLNALLDLVPLQHRDAETALANTGYFAPWRPDPRPLSGMIHGVMAFLAVAALWRDLRAVAALEEEATRQLAGIRVQVSRAAAQLLEAPGLTTAGRTFVDTMAETAEGLLRISLPAAVDRAANAELARLERHWSRTAGAGAASGAGPR